MGDLISRVSRELSVEMPFQTNVFYNKNIIIVRPNLFVANAENSFSDYHFSIPSVAPPPLKLGRKEYSVKANRVLVINPEESIMIKNSAGNLPTTEYTVLFINKKFLQEISYEIYGNSYVSFSNTNYKISNMLRYSFELFAKEFKNPHAGNLLLLESLSTQITIGLLRELKSNFSNKVHEKNYDGIQHIDRVIEYMEENYNAAINLDDLCQVANQSLYHFIRVFKQETGKTPHEYLIDIRINKAEDMMKREEHSIKEIAEICGFINLSHFCTVFKKKIGESASSYRKKL
ncbi:MAG: DNA-binding protein AraC-type [Clostridia bacterium]|jgi:AraC-like DNA-binding protein|nr:DNA-binding protein AraC-type [Clostridia bacterium]